ncbi:actin-like ATPase domain-containing protein, partial [Aureobasidium melanogenum]
MPPSRPKKDSIIVGVDFGTTHSGVSYTYRGKPDSSSEIPVVRGWQEGTGCDKVPSQLQYEVSSEATPLPSRKRRAAGSYADLKRADVHVVKWGFPASKDKGSIQMLKLLLDPQQQLPPYVSRTQLEAQLKQIGRGAVEATADFLEKLKTQALEALDKRYGKAFMANTKIDYILTVPAVWSDAAKDATLRAAEMAGLHKSRNLQMITEPEAAGLYALKQMEGTVDLISYEVKSLDPLRFEECAAGTGGICGSGLLNMRFEEHVKARMGITAFEEYVEKNSKDWNRCVEHFEQRTKRDFNPHALQNIDDMDDASIPLAGAKEDPRAGIEKNYITLTPDNLFDIFRPVMDAIVKLCDEQYISLVKEKKKPSGIILVGGFGESNHLHNVLKLHFAGIDDFEVVQPPNAWSAVARGAVIHCIEGDSLVEARVARHHYGVINRLPFDPEKHSRKNCIFEPDNETWYAENQVTWFVKKGESMPAGTPILLPFHFPSYNKLVSEVVTLVVSDEDEAPSEFSTTARTRKLGTIEVNLEKVAASRWKKQKTSSGRKYVVLDYNVGMLFGSGGLVFDMRVGEKLCGSLRAKYD